MKNYLLNHSFSSHKLPLWTAWFMTIHSFINTSAYLWECPKTPFSTGIIRYRFNLLLSDLVVCYSFFYCSFSLCIPDFFLSLYALCISHQHTIPHYCHYVCVRVCESRISIDYFSLLCENYQCIFIGTLYSQYGAIYYTHSSFCYRFWYWNIYRTAYRRSTLCTYTMLLWILIFSIFFHFSFLTDQDPSNAIIQWLQ